MRSVDCIKWKENAEWSKTNCRGKRAIHILEHHYPAVSKNEVESCLLSPECINKKLRSRELVMFFFLMKLEPHTKLEYIQREKEAYEKDVM